HPQGDSEAARDRFLDRLNRHGVVRCTPTSYHHQPGIRAALVNWMTEEQDIRLALDSLRHCLAEAA
ncbi:aspartate aminotransferase family protein, partial [Proteus mirabilis]|nr:aspartate aminotransferase family protein [Proteus mirabilis]